MASSSGVGQLGSSPPNSLALRRLLVQVGGIVEKNQRRSSQDYEKNKKHSPPHQPYHYNCSPLKADSKERKKNQRNENTNQLTLGECQPRHQKMPTIPAVPTWMRECQRQTGSNGAQTMPNDANRFQFLSLASSLAIRQ